MFAEGPNVAVLAAAGSRKSQHVIDTALEAAGRVAIVTYTVENRAQLVRRIEAARGTVPPNIEMYGWLEFLLAHGAKPFQASITGQPFGIRGLNFDGQPSRFTSKAQVQKYYFDRRRDAYARNLADFVIEANRASEGAVIDRICRIYDTLLVDEVQDMVGWDLDVLDLLLDAPMNVLLVGDVRQHTYGTNRSNRNQRYKAAGMSTWFEERVDRCRLERWTASFRCHQHICDFADRIYPELPTTQSVGVADTGHDGVFTISRAQVASYMEEHAPVVLRHDKRSDTLGLPAYNFGLVKGSTFDRVLIFPTRRMAAFVEHGDPEQLQDRARFYVAVTRARHSVAFVI